MHKTSPLKKSSFTVWLHFRVLTALLATVVDAILPIVLSAMSDHHRALLCSLHRSICNKPSFFFLSFMNLIYRSYVTRLLGP
jgi:hypothetical protein